MGGGDSGRRGCGHRTYGRHRCRQCRARPPGTSRTERARPSRPRSVGHGVRGRPQDLDRWVAEGHRRQTASPTLEYSAPSDDYVNVWTLDPKGRRVSRTATHSFTRFSFGGSDVVIASRCGIVPVHRHDRLWKQLLVSCEPVAGADSGWPVCIGRDSHRRGHAGEQGLHA